ncbi:hypothetical protein CEXT_100421, partial [Caerostris extrusa]
HISQSVFPPNLTHTHISSSILRSLIPSATTSLCAAHLILHICKPTSTPPPPRCAHGCCSGRLQRPTTSLAIPITFSAVPALAISSCCPGPGCHTSSLAVLLHLGCSTLLQYISQAVPALHAPAAFTLHKHRNPATYSVAVLTCHTRVSGHTSAVPLTTFPQFYYISAVPIYYISAVLLHLCCSTVIHFRSPTTLAFFSNLLHFRSPTTSLLFQFTTFPQFYYISAVPIYYISAVLLRFCCSTYYISAVLLHLCPSVPIYYIRSPISSLYVPIYYISPAVLLHLCCSNLLHFRSPTTSLLFQFTTFPQFYYPAVPIFYISAVLAISAVPLTAISSPTTSPKCSTFLFTFPPRSPTTSLLFQFITFPQSYYISAVPISLSISAVLLHLCCSNLLHFRSPTTSLLFHLLHFRSPTTFPAVPSLLHFAVLLHSCCSTCSNLLLFQFTTFPQFTTSLLYQFTTVLLHLCCSIYYISAVLLHLCCSNLLHFLCPTTSLLFQFTTSLPFS